MPSPQSRINTEEDGLTSFGDLEKAYEALDEATKTKIAAIEVAYQFNMQLGRQLAD